MHSRATRRSISMLASYAPAALAVSALMFCGSSEVSQMISATAPLRALVPVLQLQYVSFFRWSSLRSWLRFRSALSGGSVPGQHVQQIQQAGSNTRTTARKGIWAHSLGSDLADGDLKVCVCVGVLELMAYRVSSGLRLQELAIRIQTL